jgi:hypothetical protein
MIRSRRRYRDSGTAGTVPIIEVRTRWYDDEIAHAIGTGIRQVVILAAGMDSRAYRLEWPRDARVFELDQPEVIAEVASKHSALPNGLNSVPSNPRITGHNRNAVHQCLRNEHAIEGVAMMRRQNFQLLAVFEPDEPTYEAGIIDRGSELTRGIEFAERALDGYFPSRDATDEHFVLECEYRVPSQLR